VERQAHRARHHRLKGVLLTSYCRHVGLWTVLGNFDNICILATDVLLVRMHPAVRHKLSSKCLVETIHMVTELITAQSNHVAVLHQKCYEYSSKDMCCLTLDANIACQSGQPPSNISNIPRHVDLDLQGCRASGAWWRLWHARDEEAERCIQRQHAANVDVSHKHDSTH